MVFSGRPYPVFAMTSQVGFPCGSAGKESTRNTGDLSSIPGLGRSPGERKGYPLQYSGLESSMDCIVHGIAQSRPQLSDLYSLHPGGLSSLTLCPSPACFPVSSVPRLCRILCDPMGCSTPGFPVLHHLPEFAQTHVHQVGDAIQPSHPLLPPFSCLLSFPASGSFPMSWLFASGGQSTGNSACFQQTISKR